MSQSLPDVEAQSLLVDAKREVAAGIWLFDLVTLDDDDVPAFTPGAHLLVRTPSGAVRHYSICSAASDRRRYQIGVKRESDGRGGSVSMAEDLHEGDVVAASLPVNHFPLVDAPGGTLLIAGGIGITPILAMARHLREAGHPFRLVYCARSAAEAAFVDVLAAPEFADRTTFHYDGGEIVRALDVPALLADCPLDTHLYCCGPRGLMRAVRDATTHWPPDHAHFEDFGGGVAATGDTAFRVRLARSGGVVEVRADESILTALRRHGLDSPSSCEAGSCGACRTRLLAGTVDHRDYVLADRERDDALMICVSRAISGELTIDA